MKDEDGKGEKVRREAAIIEELEKYAEELSEKFKAGKFTEEQIGIVAPVLMGAKEKELRDKDCPPVDRRKEIESIKKVFDNKVSDN